MHYSHEGLELFTKPGPLAFFLDPSIFSQGAAPQSGEEEQWPHSEQGTTQDAGVPEETRLHTGAI